MPAVCASIKHCGEWRLWASPARTWNLAPPHTSCVTIGYLSFLSLIFPIYEIGIIAVGASWGCQKRPQPWWLRVTGIYSLIVLEARSLNISSPDGNRGVGGPTLLPEALRENPCFASGSWSWWPAFLCFGCITPVPALSSHCFLLY